ncbi:MAG: hypothetical protein OXG27_12070, partial [Chloroflexi bacterium]|nr:hypothetical protein [Chloroflexota bacterium]
MLPTLPRLQRQQICSRPQLETPAPSIAVPFSTEDLFGGYISASFATGAASSAANSVGGLVGRQVYGWTRASYAS